MVIKHKIPTQAGVESKYGCLSAVYSPVGSPQNAIHQRIITGAGNTLNIGLFGSKLIIFKDILKIENSIYKRKYNRKNIAAIEIYNEYHNRKYSNKKHNSKSNAHS